MSGEVLNEPTRSIEPVNPDSGDDERHKTENRKPSQYRPTQDFLRGTEVFCFSKTYWKETGLLRLGVDKQARWTMWFRVRPVKCLQTRMRENADKSWKRLLPLTALMRFPLWFRRARPGTAELQGINIVAISPAGTPASLPGHWGLDPVNHCLLSREKLWVKISPMEKFPR